MGKQESSAEIAKTKSDIDKERNALDSKLTTLINTKEAEMKELVAAGDKKITDSETAMDAKIADIDTKTAAADAKLKEDMLAAITESAKAQIQARDLMKGELQTEAEE